MSCGCMNKRYVAIDRETGDCLVRDPDGSCRRFVTSLGALKAAEEAGYTTAGVRRVQA